MTNRRLFVAALLGRCVRARLDRHARRAGDPARDVRQRRSTTPARRCPTSARRTSSSAKTTWRAKCCKVEPADEPMQIAMLVDNSQAARNDIAHIRTALPAFVDDADAPATAQERGRHHRASASGRPSSPTTRSSQAELKKGVDRIWSMQRIAAPTCSTASSRSARASRSARPQRPVIVAIADRRPGAEQPPARSGARAAARQRRRVPRDHASGRPSTSLSDEARERNIVLDEGPRDDRRPARRTADAAWRSTRKLKQLADELTHQYQVTYARPQSLIPPERVDGRRPRSRASRRAAR